MAVLRNYNGLKGVAQQIFWNYAPKIFWTPTATRNLDMSLEVGTPVLVKIENQC